MSETHFTDNFRHSVSAQGINCTLTCGVMPIGLLNGDWRETKPGTEWVNESGGLRCVFKIDRDERYLVYHMSLTNVSGDPIALEGIIFGPESLRWDIGLESPHALYSLHTRVTGINDYDANEVNGLPPLAPLPSGEWHELSSRCPELPHLEGLVISNGWDRPGFVDGPLTQNHAHLRRKVRWDGNAVIQFDSCGYFLGLDQRCLAPGEEITESGFLQVTPDGNLNEILRDYLGELAESTGSRGERNPLIRERFFCTWNNFIYWEANQEEILPSVSLVKECLPSNQWYLLDDGYMVSKGSQSVMDRNADGERIHTLESELPWFHNCPGISFLFDGGSGVDYQKFPDGLDGFAAKVKAIGLRPALWVGFETSRHAPAAQKHPDWFMDIGHESHLIPDLSVPEVREQIRNAFETIFNVWGFEAIKTDFITHLTDNPAIRYRFQEKSGAEWRKWLFSCLREYIPEDGFVTLGCWIAMGAPWHAPYIDSYRDSMDARDGNWQTVLSNVRWSILPSLSGGSGQPIPDADSVSVFKGMAKDAMQTWINYARVGGMLVEAGGDVLRWNSSDIEWVEKALAHETSGSRVWFADRKFWSRDGLPCASYREASEGAFLLGIYNWSELAMEIIPDWIGPINQCSSFSCLTTGENFTLEQVSSLELEGQASRLFLAK